MTLRNLTEVTLANNNLTGLIPSAIFNSSKIEVINLYLNNFSGRLPSSIGHCTTRKTSSCSGPIAAGAKTAAICRLLRRIFGPPLYMRSIAAFFVTAAIGRVFCGVL